MNKGDGEPMKAFKIQIFFLMSLLIFGVCLADDPRKDPSLRIHEPEVTLESAEKEHAITVNVPESVAFQSPVIKNAVLRAEGIGEPVRFLKFDDISGVNLDIYVQAMRIMRDLHDKDPHTPISVEVAAIEKGVKFPEEMALGQLTELINQAAYLQLKGLVQVVARFIARAIHDCDMSRDDLQNISQEIVAQIARHYYLIYNQAIPGITIPYGVSIRELLVLNRLPEIPEYWEYDLSELRINSLDGLQDIPDIGKVKLLNLSHNELTEVKEGDFVGLGNLDELILSHNRLTKLPAKTFRGLGSLTSLVVSHNWIETMDVKALDGLGSLKRLDLSSNSLVDLAEQLFSGLGNMEWLSLANNNLNVLTTKSFRDISSLKELILQDNEIRKLVANGFEELGNLENLDLSYNEIQEISYNAFKGLGALKRLNLQVNRIKSLPSMVFQNLKNITFLSLASNQLVGDRKSVV